MRSRAPCRRLPERSPSTSRRCRFPRVSMIGQWKMPSVRSHARRWKAGSSTPSSDLQHSSPKDASRRPLRSIPSHTSTASARLPASVDSFDMHIAARVGGVTPGLAVRVYEERRWKHPLRAAPPPGTRGQIGRQTFDMARALIKDGKKPTEAFNIVAERTGRSAATVATAYYRVARTMPDGAGVKQRSRSGRTASGRARSARTVKKRSTRRGRTCGLAGRDDVATRATARRCGCCTVGACRAPRA